MPEQHKTVRIEYVGSKPVKYDRIANSGKVWHGHGDIQEVEPKQAVLLCKHKMVWRLADPKGQPRREVKVPSSGTSLDIQEFLGLNYFSMKSKLKDFTPEKVIEIEGVEESTKKRPGVLKLLRERMSVDAKS